MMTPRILYIFFCFSFFLPVVQAQVKQPPPEGPASSPEQYEAMYRERIKLSEIGGVYIPVDLEDAYQQLARLAPPESLAFFREQSEDEVIEKLFPKLGRWIILNWGFEGGSRMSHHLRELGIFAPEDMSRLIMRSWHRHLNENPIDIDGQIQIIQERVRQEQLDRKQEGKVIQETRRKVDPATRRQ